MKVDTILYIFLFTFKYFWLSLNLKGRSLWFNIQKFFSFIFIYIFEILFKQGFAKIKLFFFNILFIYIYLNYVTILTIILKLSKKCKVYMF